jgi:hypothetical protein
MQDLPIGKSSNAPLYGKYDQGAGLRTSECRPMMSGCAALEKREVGSLACSSRSIHPSGIIDDGRVTQTKSFSEEPPLKFRLN